MPGEEVLFKSTQKALSTSPEVGFPLGTKGPVQPAQLSRTQSPESQRHLVDFCDLGSTTASQYNQRVLAPAIGAILGQYLAPGKVTTQSREEGECN